MSESKHTPRPWRVVRHGYPAGTYRLDVRPHDGNINIARCCIAMGAAANEVCSLPTAESQANAVLIARAPDLLRERDELREALRAVAVWDHTGVFGDAAITGDINLAAKHVEEMQAAARATLARCK